ncbi:MAG: PAS domain-containing sensor histidine kinase [Microcoleaceae cyanobacterium]
MNNPLEQSPSEDTTDSCHLTSLKAKVSETLNTVTELESNTQNLTPSASTKEKKSQNPLWKNHLLVNFLTFSLLLLGVSNLASYFSIKQLEPAPNNEISDQDFISPKNQDRLNSTIGIIVGGDILIFGLLMVLYRQIKTEINHYKKIENIVKIANNKLEQKMAKCHEELRKVKASLQAEMEEREDTKSALGSSQERFRRAILYAPIPIMLHAEDGEVLQISSTWSELTGYELEEISTITDWTKKAYPENYAKVQADIKSLYSLDEPLAEGEYTITTKSGAKRIWEFKAALLGKLSDSRQLALSAALDITERKKVEQALQQTTTQLSEILESISDAFYALDRQCSFTYVNQKAATLFGKDREFLIGKNIWEQFPETVGSKPYQEIIRILHGGGVTEFEAICPVFNCWVFEQVYSSSTGVSVLLHDITDRKEAENALKISEEQLRLALNAAKMGTWDWNLITGEIIWSEWHAKLLGLELENFGATYEAFARCVHHEDMEELNQRVEIARVTHSEYENEFRVIWPDGSIHWIEARGKFFYNEKGDAFRMRGVVMDVTERKEAQKQLEETQKFLEKIADSIPNLLYIMDFRKSHNIYINQRNREFFGLSLDQIKFRGYPFVEELIHPDDRYKMQQFPQLFAQAKDGEVIENEFRMKNAQGEWRWLHTWDMVFARNSQGVPVQILGSAIDITDAKNALQKIQFQARLLDAVEQAVIVTDLAGKIIYWNRYAEVLYGWNSSEVINHSLVEVIIPPLLHQQYRQILDSLQRGNNSSSGEFLLQGRDGKTFPAAIIASPLYNDQEELIGIIEVSIDISDRVLVETALRQSEERFRIALQSAPIVVFNQDRELRYTWVYHSLRNYHIQEMLGKLDLDLIEIQNEAEHLTKIKKFVLETGQGSREEVAITHKEQLNYYDFTLEPLRDSNGEIIGITGAAVDISDRKRTELALGQSEAKFRSLSECSPIGIILMDREGLCIYTNPRFLKIVHYSFEEALGTGWLSFIHPEDRESILNKWFETVSQHQEDFFKVIRYIRKDKAIRFCEVRTAPVTTDQGELIGYVGTMEDITERRVIEQMKQEFISIVSHELRTPLTSIRGSLGLLASGIYDNKPDKAKRMLQIASTDTERLVRLVSDILDLERLESGKVHLIPQCCDVTTLMSQSVDAMGAMAEENQVTLAINPVSLTVFADSDAMIQTLTNLLSNAIKFSPPHSTIELNAELIDTENLTTGEHQERVNFIKPVPCILFQVKDQGRGIPTEQLDLIFGQFQQVDASDSRQKGGTGLGLAICRSIVSQHGGQIWVESLVGKGSTFFFTLPLPPQS